MRIRVCRLLGPAAAWRSVRTCRVCLGPGKCLLFRSPAREGLGAYIMLGVGARLNDRWWIVLEQLALSDKCLWRVSESVRTMRQFTFFFSLKGRDRTVSEPFGPFDGGHLRCFRTGRAMTG